MTRTENRQDNLTTLICGVLKGTYFFFLNALRVAFRRSFWTFSMTVFWISYAVSFTAIIYSPKRNFAYWLYHLSGNATLQWIAKTIQLHVPKYWLLILVPIPFLIFCFWIALPHLIRNKKMESRLRHLGLKTAIGLEPKVIDVVRLTEGKEKLLIKAEGIDIASLTSKRGALESGLNKIVQEIRTSPTSRQIFEVIVADKDLPRKIPFESVTTYLKSPYTFLVGEAHAGFIVGDLRELHHMLIAGSTGGGKSVFFKQALVSLLKTSKYMHLYLIDLKRGVEMKLFEQLPNVYVAKEVVDAVTCLRRLVEEMERRFIYLESKNFTEIDPERDKLDRLVIGIDEASVLFTVERGGNDSNKKYALEARELTDKLTKLGRAAGIHVILATQKVTKETIDTRVQTNVGAKICFRVNTIPSSMTVLGNARAAELPEIKGRAIWLVGSNDVEVQVPYLSHEEVKEEIEKIASELSTGEEKPFQKLLIDPLRDSKAQVLPSAGSFIEDGDAT